MYGVPSAGLPLGNLVALNGKLYGTALAGGPNDDGIVYSITTAGKIQLLHTFAGAPDGACPAAGLLNVNGLLYGTTMCGGAYRRGSVYAISTKGEEKVLFSFDRTDGGGPAAPLLAVNGRLYGTTVYGGSAVLGTVFSMTMSGKDEKVLHSFGHKPLDGARPAAGLIEVNGRLYGTAMFGGVRSGPSGNCHAYGCGIIYSITTAGHEVVLHYFAQDYENDGAGPAANLIEVKGRLYGTTEDGGYSPACDSYPCYDGTIFSIEVQ
jgi:uncharacterized repeat protein (TIGR03803 family)